MPRKTLLTLVTASVAMLHVSAAPSRAGDDDLVRLLAEITALAAAGTWRAVEGEVHPAYRLTADEPRERRRRGDRDRADRNGGRDEWPGRRDRSNREVNIDPPDRHQRPRREVNIDPPDRHQRPHREVNIDPPDRHQRPHREVNIDPPDRHARPGAGPNFDPPRRQRQPRHAAPVQRQYMLPGQCLRTAATRAGPVHFLAQRCLMRNYASEPSLPAICLSRIYTLNGGVRMGYGPRCLGGFGYRMANH